MLLKEGRWEFWSAAKEEKDPTQSVGKSPRRGFRIPCRVVTGNNSRVWYWGTMEGF